MHILMVGDVIGGPGRRAVKAIVPELRAEYGIDLVVANAENAAGGFGLTPETAQELLSAGVDVLTSGNHIWDQKEMIPWLDGEMPILRPLNYPPGVVGRGHWTREGIMVVSLMGRTFMQDLDCPFRAMDRLLSSLLRQPVVIIVDFHAEATSEKGAMGWYLDGKVTMVLGTHTHVGTVDARILPKGTAFVTDVGMVGPLNSIIGDDPQPIIQRFLTQVPNRFAVGKGPTVFNSVLVEVDEGTGKALHIQRMDKVLP